jgi:hypothetical protein
MKAEPKIRDLSKDNSKNIKNWIKENNNEK